MAMQIDCYLSVNSCRLLSSDYLSVPAGTNHKKRWVTRTESSGQKINLASLGFTRSYWSILAFERSLGAAPSMPTAKFS